MLCVLCVCLASSALQEFSDSPRC